VNPMDLGALGGLLSGFQQRAADMKDRAAKTSVTGAAGGLVRVTMTGDYQVTAVQIAPAAMEDRELLEDLVRAATQDALGQVQAKVAAGLSELTGGMPIPPGLFPGM